jgi:hypothetical protein
MDLLATLGLTRTAAIVWVLAGAAAAVALAIVRRRTGRVIRTSLDLGTGL